MDRSHRRARAGFPDLGLACGVALLSGLVAACGSDSNDLVPPSGHGHIEIGSTAPESGALAMELPFTTVEVTESAEVGSFTLWSSTDPAIATIEEDEPGEGLYQIADGVPVSLELTALDDGVRFTYGGVTLDQPGAAVVLGVAPFHDHGQWEVVLPQGVHEGEFDISFRFTSPPFAPSEAATFTLVPTEGEPGHDDDPDEDDES